MNTKEIEEILSKYLYNESTISICRRFLGAGYSEMDIAKITNTEYIYEYEIKISRGDFLKEVKNYDKKINRSKFWKHRIMNESFENKKSRKSRKIYNIPNKYYFVCPENLIKIDELLKHQGLIYIKNDGTVKIIKEAKFLHKDKITLKTYKRLIKTLSEREIYDGVSKITFELRN